MSSQVSLAAEKQLCCQKSASLTDDSLARLLSQVRAPPWVHGTGMVLVGTGQQEATAYLADHYPCF